MPLRNHAYSSSLGRSESRPSSFPDQHFELVTELLDVGDVGSDGAVVERADGGAGAALGYVEDRVEILLAAMAGQDALAHLVDPARGLAARRALAARLVSVEAGHHHERLGDRYGLVEHHDARRTAHGLRPEAGEPGGAAIDDVRHLRDRLDVVYDRRHAEGALDGGERRLDLRPALLALERRDQARLLAADVGAGAPVDHDVEADTEQAGVVRVFHRRREAAMGLDVLTADVDERLLAPDGARGDQHAFDEL